jgi:hypothetical protein
MAMNVSGFSDPHCDDAPTLASLAAVADAGRAIL